MIVIELSGDPPLHDVVQALVEIRRRCELHEGRERVAVFASHIERVVLPHRYSTAATFDVVASLSEFGEVTIERRRWF